MSADCKNENPLKRTGVSQYERVLKALLPDFVHVDERDQADLILFAKNYSRQLNFFNEGNVQDGDWHALMGMDVSVTLASLVKLNIRGCFSHVRELLLLINTTDTSDEVDLKNYFKALFDTLFSFTELLDKQYSALPNEFPFKKVLGNLIHSKLPEYYDRLRKYFELALLEGVIDETSTYIHKDPPLTIILSQKFKPDSLGGIWTDVSIPVFTATLNGANTGAKIKNTCLHNLFRAVIDSYLKTLGAVVESAKVHFELTLSNYPTHAPQYALYITFIKLFKYSQNHLNRFTKRHLDLYYKEILRLAYRPPQPDNVHLTFELSKTASENYQLKKGTVFKAGKDQDGEEIFYSLIDDVVLNKAKIASLKGLYIDQDLNNDTKQVFASPVANSEDGEGAKPVSADKSWLTFGDTSRNKAIVGFSIASRYLFLQEGTRTITFVFHKKAGSTLGFNKSQIQNIFALQLSGEKGWLDVPIDPANVVVNRAGSSFSIQVVLDGGEGAIVPYDESVHMEHLSTNLPVAKFIVQEAKAANAVWNFQPEKVEIKVDVKNMRGMIVENQEGAVNPAKPFEPFGAIPKIDSNLLISCKEIMMKAYEPRDNVKVKVTLTWDDLDQLNRLVPVSAKKLVDSYFLEDAEWVQVGTGNLLFSSRFKISNDFVVSGFPLLADPEIEFSMAPIDPSIVSENTFSDVGILGSSKFDNLYLYGYFPSTVISIDLPKADVGEDYSEDEHFSPESKWEYLKIELKSEFGHSTYAQDVTNAAINATVSTVSDDSGNFTTTVNMDNVPEPYTPKVKDFYLSYSTETILDFNTSESRYFHMTPFGYSEISGAGDRYLLPTFDDEGEFYIGVSDFTPNQTLSVLFQVSEGSADPLTVKQQVEWSFLGIDNEWCPFEKEEIADATNDLTQSGIIRFSIPATIAFTNSLMTDSLNWIRGVVHQKTNAVCKIIEVTAQAALTEFTDYRNTGNHFKQRLPSNVISKLVVSDASIKKVNQPFASFGGRSTEADDQYYVRVSERLRHKSRGISMWDYERLVLEEFPEIYKVKCVNHTEILEKTVGSKTVYTDNELQPGHVLVVPIPDLHNKNAYDPLRPNTSLGLMAEIKKWLTTRISSHVNLDVRNPRFEEIQLEFSVLYLTDDKVFNTSKLKQELQEFMAPWAYDTSTSVEFGSKISKSVLINFIEERDYVDFITCVKMYHITGGVKSGDVDEALATSSRTIFVSVKTDDPINAHRIRILENTECDC